MSDAVIEADKTQDGKRDATEAQRLQVTHLANVHASLVI